MRYFITDSVEAAATPPAEVLSCLNNQPIPPNNGFLRLFRLRPILDAVTALFVALLSAASCRLSELSEKIGGWIGTT